MIKLINYGDGKFKKAQKLNTKTAYSKGKVENVISYSSADLDQDFLKKNESILTQKRGAGYWLWKPYLIKKTMDIMQEGDYLVYSDSGIYFIDSVEYLINALEITKQDIMPFSTGKHIEKNWTKRDIFVEMNCDTEYFWNSRQLWAGFILFKVTEKSKAFVQEWLDWCEQGHLLTDEKSINPNLEGYIETRHDQSIYSLLIKKYGYVDFRDPSQHGVFRKERFSKESLERSNYPTIIDAHRQGTSGSIAQIKLIRVRRWLHNCINTKKIIPYNEQFR